MLVIGKFVTGNLFRQELVIRFVTVESANYVVAITESEGAGQVGGELAAFRVRVPSYVQPVAAPTLAITRRRDQPVHQLLVSERIRITHKFFHFAWLWRQAGE